MELDQKVVVKRIGTPCCGMEVGKTYFDAFTDASRWYVKVKLPNGDWTSDHWAPDMFEFLEAEE